MSVIRYRTYNGTTRYKVRNPHFSGMGSFVCGYIPGQDSDSDSDSDSDIHFSIPIYYPNAIDDYDGNWYDAVVIGDQVWTVQNLRTTHYSDGTAITNGGNNYSDTVPYYYNNTNSDILLVDRGYYYNWGAVMHGASQSSANPSGVQGIAPTGWHIPSEGEFKSLSDYVSNTYGYRINKHLGYQNYWPQNSDVDSIGYYANNNSTLFGAVPAGYVSFNGSTAYFTDAYTLAAFRSTTTHIETGDSYCVYCGIGNSDTYPTIYDYFPKNCGASVRCVHNLQPIGFAAWYYNEYGSYNHQVS